MAIKTTYTDIYSYYGVDFLFVRQKPVKPVQSEWYLFTV